MIPVSWDSDDKIPSPSVLSDEVPPAASLATGLATDTVWLRGPVRLAGTIVGIEGISHGWRLESREPFRWETPAASCVACLEGSSHDGYERYLPARHYRKIAADFLRLSNDRDVHEFTQNWGLIRLDRLVPDPVPPADMGWANTRRVLSRIGSAHGQQPDLIDEVLDWVAWARLAFEAAYNLEEDTHRRAYNRVVALIRTMETGFAPGPGVGVHLIPTTLLHVVCFALLGLYNGAGRLVCAEWLSGCPSEISIHRGRGRPRIYCSDQCGWRARNRRRQEAARRSRGGAVSAAE